MSQLPTEEWYKTIRADKKFISVESYKNNHCEFQIRNWHQFPAWNNISKNDFNKVIDISTRAPVIKLNNNVTKTLLISSSIQTDVISSQEASTQTDQLHQVSVVEDDSILLSSFSTPNSQTEMRSRLREREGLRAIVEEK